MAIEELEQALRENRQLNQEIADHMKVLYVAFHSLLDALSERDVVLKERFRSKFQEKAVQQGGLDNQAILQFLAKSLRERGGQTN